MGKKKSCVKFIVVPISGNPPGLRCVEFKAGKAHPVTPGQGLVGGGRSQHYIRPGGKIRDVDTRGRVAAPKRKPAKSKSKARRSRK